VKAEEEGEAKSLKLWGSTFEASIVSGKHNMWERKGWRGLFYNKKVVTYEGKGAQSVHKFSTGRGSSLTRESMSCYDQKKGRKRECQGIPIEEDSRKKDAKGERARKIRAGGAHCIRLWENKKVIH